MGPLNWRKPNPITGISLKDDSGNIISNKSISIGVHDSQLVEATVTPSNAFWNGNIYRWGSTGIADCTRVGRSGLAERQS